MKTSEGTSEAKVLPPRKLPDYNALENLAVARATIAIRRKPNQVLATMEAEVKALYKAKLVEAVNQFPEMWPSNVPFLGDHTHEPPLQPGDWTPELSGILRSKANLYKRWQDNIRKESAESHTLQCTTPCLHHAPSIPLPRRSTDSRSSRSVFIVTSRSTLVRRRYEPGRVQARHARWATSRSARATAGRPPEPPLPPPPSPPPPSATPPVTRSSRTRRHPRRLSLLATTIPVPPLQLPRRRQLFFVPCTPGAGRLPSTVRSAARVILLRLSSRPLAAPHRAAPHRKFINCYSCSGSRDHAEQGRSRVCGTETTREGYDGQGHARGGGAQQ